MALFCILLEILVLLIVTILYLMRRNMSYWKRRGIPHDVPNFLEGNMRGWRTQRNQHTIFQAYYEKYKPSGEPFCGFYFLQRPMVFVLDMELAKHVLIKDFANFNDKGLFHNERDDPISAHLFFLDGPKWRALRQQLSPTFTSGKMKYMFPTVVTVAEQLMATMKLHTATPQRAAVIDMLDLVSRYTSDVIGTCAFGIECNSLREPAAEFRQMGKFAITEFRHNKVLLGFMHSYPTLARRLRMVKTHSKVSEFYTRIVRETVALREAHNIQRSDFMNLLIELKNGTAQNELLQGLTLSELTAQAFVFFIAGFETSSSTLSYALYELARHPPVQDRLRREVCATLADAVLSYERIKSMRYMDQVIAETLRLYTIVPNLDRKAAARYVVPGRPDYVIEAGMTVIIPVAAIHRDPAYFPEPNAFKPERFSPEVADFSCWLPFGDGPRNCIGKRFAEMQIKIALALLLKNFRFTVCKETAIPLEFNPKNFVLGTKGGICLNVEEI